MIEVKNLTKKYGNNLAVDNLSFTIEDGNIYGFLGPNGAGKSTTMNIITGCLSATSGSVSIDGKDIFENPIEAKKSIGYLPEQPPLYIDMTPYEYLDFVADAKGISKADKLSEIESVMEKTGIRDVANRLIRNLSKGYKQRVGIAQAMLGSPKIIILDEPTVGLDPKQIIEIRELIRSLSKEHTVILSSHILSEIQEVCDKVIIIANGKLKANGTLDEVANQNSEYNNITLIARATPEAVLEIVDNIEEIVHYAVFEHEDGAVSEIAVPCEIDIRERLFSEFVAKGITLLEMSTVRPSLETVYLSLTEKLDEIEEDRQDEQDEESEDKTGITDENMQDDLPKKAQSEEDDDEEDYVSPFSGEVE